MKKIIVPGVVVLVIAVLFSCVSLYPDPRQADGAVPALRKASYDFSRETPLISRVGPPPEFVLDYLKAYDKQDGYSGYMPSPPMRLRHNPVCVSSVASGHCLKRARYSSTGVGVGLSVRISNMTGRRMAVAHQPPSSSLE